MGNSPRTDEAIQKLLDAQRPRYKITCPHCASGILWSEDRGAHCDGCDDFDPETDLKTNWPLEILRIMLVLMSFALLGVSAWRVMVLLPAGAYWQVIILTVCACVHMWMLNRARQFYCHRFFTKSSNTEP